MTEVRRFRISKGLDLSIAGAPAQQIAERRDTSAAGVLGRDYRGVSPRLLVSEGDRVSLGQALFEDRKRPALKITSPASGTVSAINRGARRSLASIVVESAGQDEQMFPAHAADRLSGLGRNTIRDTLLESGLWTAFRTRPFGKVPDPAGSPQAIFVTAIDTNPLAPDPAVVIAEHSEDFGHGLTLLARLNEMPVFLCRRQGAAVPAGDPTRITVAEFEGPHPAGLPGTHIHLLAPVGAKRSVWHIGYQEVIAIGKLFTTGRLWVERVIALAGPGVARPRLMQTRFGAAVGELTAGELCEEEPRVIAGSVLSGRRAEGALAYLGRHDLQVSVLGDGVQPRPSRLPDRLRGWISAGSLFGRLQGGRDRAVTNALNGQPGALIPVEGFERVMPLDILPVPLFRALLVGDTDMARALGCLELDEEDLALATFLCPGKQEYGALLRAALDSIDREAP